MICVLDECTQMLVVRSFRLRFIMGDFLLGMVTLRSYVNGKVAWFDHVETDTWSPLWLDQFVVDLGYLMALD